MMYWTIGLCLMGIGFTLLAERLLKNKALESVLLVNYPDFLDNLALVLLNLSPKDNWEVIGRTKLVIYNADCSAQIVLRITLTGRVLIDSPRVFIPKPLNKKFKRLLKNILMNYSAHTDDMSGYLDRKLWVFGLRLKHAQTILNDCQNSNKVK